MVFANDIYFMRDLNIFLQLDNKKVPPQKKSDSKAGRAFNGHFFKKKKYTIGREAPEKMFNIISH